MQLAVFIASIPPISKRCRFKPNIIQYKERDGYRAPLEFAASPTNSLNQKANDVLHPYLQAMLKIFKAHFGAYLVLVGVALSSKFCSSRFRDLEHFGPFETEPTNSRAQAPSDWFKISIFKP